MSRPLGYLAILIVSASCSQRAPWRVVPEPATSRPRAVTQSGGSSGTSGASAPALATAAPAPVPEVAPLDAASAAHLADLLFPVPAVQSTRLDDSFNDPRDGGERRHAAIDILAPRGTPILSADDGRVLRLSKNTKGGITVYATDLDEHFVYYYAHLDRYYAGLYQGKPLMRGDTLGFVGTTGNAPANVPHLHFQVMRMPPDRKFWNGEPVNPYPFLRQSAQGSTAQSVTAP
jgi:murein DD-endopeptidase MepM/ murein hydrolase activator NlpD